jgi:hypothetical protein
MAVVAAAALLGAFALGWQSAPRTPPEPDAVQVGLIGREAPAAAADAAPAPAAARGAIVHAADTRVVDVDREPPAADAPARVTPAASAPPPPAKAKPRRSAASRQPARHPSREGRREDPEKKSFFERELFRIVIR